jgi:MSHA pilin protein MshC
MRRFQPQRGFTLIELVMVIVLIGIISVYAAPRLGSLTAYNLTQATNELIEVIRFAQETSMIRVDSGFQVVTGGADHYRVSEYDYTGPTLSNIASPLTGSSPFTANSGEWSGITTSGLSISFDTRGYPCASVAPCMAHMTSVQTISLTAAGESRTITIEPITGFVHAN